MKKIGVVGVAGGWSSEKLTDTTADLTGFRLLVEMDRVRADLDRGRILFDNVDLGTLDALIVKKVGARYSANLLDRLEVLRYLEARGVRIFSPPTHIMRVIDRLSCTMTLRLKGMPMPPTSITEDVDAAHAVVREYGRTVFKPLYSSKAAGMVVIEDNDSAADEIRQFSKTNPMMYIQKLIDHRGRDLGVSFLGGRYLATYARSNGNPSAWNTTTRSGGIYEPCKPSPEIIELAFRAQKPFGLDFTCVDIAEPPEGPVVFEVSAFGGFRGLETANGIDAAELLVRHVMSELDR